VQPAAVSKAAMPLIAQWLYMIELLYEKIDNSPEDIEPIDVVVGAVSESVMTSDAPKPAQESAVVGIIMAIREQADSIADEDLMFGCKRMEGRSNVMDKFSTSWKMLWRKMMMTMMTLVTTKTDTLAHIVAGCYKVDQSANAQFVVSRSYS